jgi:proteasome accessory factor B
MTTLQAEKNYSANDLSKIFGISRRTFFRDLKELQAVGIPCRYNSSSGGYSMAPEFYLPPVDFNLTEALSLLLLVHKARTAVTFPFKKAALIAALKIENNLPANIRKYCDTALKHISSRPIPHVSTPNLDKIFAQLHNAISKKQKVKIKYNSFYEKQVIETELSPYHLMHNKRAWYVMGLSAMHNSVRTFKLNRIAQIAILDKCFVEDETFDPEEQLSKAWSMIPEGRIYNIKLRFMPKVAGNVTEVRWHSTQKVTHNPDGSAIMEFRVDGLNEICWWILGYGDQVQVLAPKAMRKKIIDIAKKMITTNECI